MGWVLPYHLASSDILLALSPSSEHDWLGKRQGDLLQALGLESLARRQDAVSRLRAVYASIFDLAEELSEVSTVTAAQDALATVTS
jgi:hypothetical protein